jgi:hypothetical protein
MCPHASIDPADGEWRFSETGLQREVDRMNKRKEDEAKNTVGPLRDELRSNCQKETKDPLMEKYTEHVIKTVESTASELPLHPVENPNVDFNAFKAIMDAACSGDMSPQLVEYCRKEGNLDTVKRLIERFRSHATVERGPDVLVPVRSDVPNAERKKKKRVKRKVSKGASTPVVKETSNGSTSTEDFHSRPLVAGQRFAKATTGQNQPSSLQGARVLATQSTSSTPLRREKRVSFGKSISPGGGLTTVGPNAALRLRSSRSSSK